MNVRAILYGLGLIAPASAFIQPFRQKYRQASSWLRTALVSLASVATVWSALGFFLLAEGAQLSPSSFRSLDHIKSGLAGMLVGMAVFIVIHPEYRKLRNSPSRPVSLGSAASG